MTHNLCLLLLILCTFASSVLANHDFSPAKPYILSKTKPTYFVYNRGTGQTYYEFRPDESYRQISREHLGVFKTGSGKWTQDSNGIVTLVSRRHCSDVIAKPLSLHVGFRKFIKYLPDYRGNLLKIIEKYQHKTFSISHFRKLRGDFPKILMLFPDRGHRAVSKSDLQNLANQIEKYCAEPSMRNIKFVPLQYKDKVFITYLNRALNRDYANACKYIDNPKSVSIMRNPIKVPSKSFLHGTRTTYPFQYLKDMNTVMKKERNTSPK